ELSLSNTEQAFRTNRRFDAFRPSVTALLAQKDVRFLPEASSPSFLEKGKGTPTQIPGDPLSVYWSDLRKLRPTSRQEEFILARSIALLRDVIYNLLLENPTATGLAVVQEHLSPYSDVLKKIKDEKIEFTRRRPKSAILSRLQQRLSELRVIQNALVDRNLHLVPTLAGRYKGIGVPWEDLIQEGNASLLRAVERFDYLQGIRFASYANWWIQQGILHALSFQSRTVRLPVYLAQALHRVRNAQANHEDLLSASELSKLVGVSEDRVNRALDADRNCLSIERPSSHSDDSNFRDQLPDLHETILPGTPSNEELKDSLEDLLNRLPSREALVLRLRFGLTEDGKTQTLEEVRQVLGVSRERVRQLQSQALRRLKNPTPLKKLAKFA
ncbi:MAG: sigma-70 family RNA polymerase sigma factor, partial [Planctomycetota bacterium]|nr:sigma-70 family RNA polymerase sigma factor [Planctomycetota bacterium]